MANTEHPHATAPYARAVLVVQDLVDVFKRTKLPKGNPRHLSKENFEAAIKDKCIALLRHRNIGCVMFFLSAHQIMQDTSGVRNAGMCQPIVSQGSRTSDHLQVCQPTRDWPGRSTFLRCSECLCSGPHATHRARHRATVASHLHSTSGRARRPEPEVRMPALAGGRPRSSQAPAGSIQTRSCESAGFQLPAPAASAVGPARGVHPDQDRPRRPCDRCRRRERADIARRARAARAGVARDRHACQPGAPWLCKPGSYFVVGPLRRVCLPLAAAPSAGARRCCSLCQPGSSLLICRACAATH